MRQNNERAAQQFHLTKTRKRDAGLVFCVFCAGWENRGQVSKLASLVKNFLPELTRLAPLDMAPLFDSPRKQSSLLPHPLQKHKNTSLDAGVFVFCAGWENRTPNLSLEN